MSLRAILQAIGDEVEDANDEAFLLFSQEIPSQNLGFIDSKASEVDVSISGREFTIHQSPTVLASKRSGGTTGAVLWRVTPFLAEWLCNKDNILWTSSLLNPDSNVVELGCGVSGLLALSLAPSINHYIATDQEYVRKVFKENLAANPNSSLNPTSARSARQSSGKNGARRRQNVQKHSKHHHQSAVGGREQVDETENGAHANITFAPLDWEVDCPSTLQSYIPSNNNDGKAERSSRSPNRIRNDDDATSTKDAGFDLLLGCDCIYNDALIAPFVSTCAEICRLRPPLRPGAKDGDMDENPYGAGGDGEDGTLRPTICIVAQQLRSHEVFENWLMEALVDFHVWRVRDDVLRRGAGGNPGFAVHVLVLRDEA